MRFSLFNAKTFLSLALALIVASASAASLPESYALRTASGAAGRVDSALDTWFTKFAAPNISLDDARISFDKKLTSFDALTKAFMRLRYANSRLRDEKQPLQDALELVRKVDGGEEITAGHPLLPYLLAEIAKSPHVAPEVLLQANQRLDNLPGRSCPQRERIIKSFEDDAAKNFDVDDLKIILAKIAGYRSKRFRERALDGLIYTLPLEKQQAVKDDLVPMVQEFPKLLDDNAWLRPTTDSDARRLDLVFSDAIQESKAGKCNTGRQHLLDTLAKLEENVGFDAAKTATTAVAACFKRKGHQARLQLWRDFEKPLEEKYAFLGRELALRSQGTILWGDDQFDEAKRIFRELIKAAQLHGHRDAEANALFTLARIEENEGKNTDAIQTYDAYIAAFPDHAKYEDAVMALLLLNFVSDRKQEALKNVEDYLLAQSNLSLDEKSVAGNSFILFWGGRLHLALGNRAMAMDMWRRLATDYYSTFYGAMGHYLLERVSGKAYELQPSRTPAFNADQVFASFSVEERPTLARIQSLLKIGQKNDAVCELAELDASGPNQDRQLAKAMLQNAAGQWLDAIKTFDALPRSYRHALPAGFERILYPIAYQPAINNYAKQLGLDPDLIYAIIRQESVFNPVARSSVGASGLMQLMPKTAALEAKRLSAGYLSDAKRRELQSMSGSASYLLNADTNVALGIHHVHRLLNKYKNPVLVLTSYNANPTATERWMTKLPTEDFLVFIERIPYNETRVYAKLVLRNYFYYKRWYQGSKKSLPHLDSVVRNVLVAANAKSVKKPAATKVQ